MYASIPPATRCKSLKTKHKKKTAHPLPISDENIQIEARFINPPRRHAQSLSVNRSSTIMLRIMTSRPMVTMISSTKPNQPSTMALVPTPLLTDPLPRSCAIVAAATDAVCCQSTLTSTKMDAMKMSASATCDTGREGNGLTSTSDPCRSCSSCQPGKVASRMKVMKARMIATILFVTLD